MYSVDVDDFDGVIIQSDEWLPVYSHANNHLKVGKDYNIHFNGEVNDDSSALGDPHGFMDDLFKIMKKNHIKSIKISKINLNKKGE